MSSLDQVKSIAKQVLSNVITAIAGLFVALNIAGFSGLFRNFWQGPNGWTPEDDRLAFIFEGLKGFIASSISKGWLFGLLITPLVLMPALKRSWLVRLAIWTVGGAIYGQFAFGGYIYRGDASGLIMAPYGLYCGLLAEVVHKGLWKGLSGLRNGLIHLQQQEVGS